MSTDVVPFEQRIGALSVADIRAQVNLIQHIMREVMKEGEHYGVIPGTGTKPTLLKGGAEKLCLTFRLDPQYEITEIRDGSHLTTTSRCVLWHIPSGQRFGSGMGSCSTRESKYAYRQAKRKCPACGAEAINRSKYPPKGHPEAAPGWYCHVKQAGCGEGFLADDVRITEQAVGRIPNEDVADQYNTVLKMANKRSLVAAVLNVTAASDIFTQDIEDSAQDDAKLRTLENAPSESAPAATTASTDAPPASAPEQPGAETISADQAIYLEDLCREHHVTVDALRKTAQVERLSLILRADYGRAVAWIEKHGKQRA